MPHDEPHDDGPVPGEPDPGFRHAPVLLDRVVEVLAAVPAGTLVDLTLGGAGHAAALLDAHPGLRLVGIDRDPSALEAAGERLAPYGDRVTALRHARSDQLDEVLDDLGVTDVVAVLGDLGVSSHQIDTAGRGFSFREDLGGPLDMRMDPSTGSTAADLLNRLDVGEITRLLRDLADERWAGRIARAVVAARPVTTTQELADLVERSVPVAHRRRGHPAKRTFQALRIAVNDELGILERTLDQVIEVLVPGGRAAFITYHSGEDRLVKRRFRLANDGDCQCPPGLPCVCGAEPEAHLLSRHGWTPSDDEVAANPRARSARLRAVEKLEPATDSGEQRP